ncbi:MAG: YraN family protein [Gemmatimonadaceae bacterium]
MARRHGRRHDAGRQSRDRRDHRRRSGTPVALLRGVPGSPDRQSLGKLGEDLACRELERRGYAIVARRHRTRYGEIDIISERDGMLVFVEVKARRTAHHGTAVEAVTCWKQRRVAAMALDYLARVRRLNSRCRFDVIAIDGVATDRIRLRVIENAFPAIGVAARWGR